MAVKMSAQLTRAQREFNGLDRIADQLIDQPRGTRYAVVAYSVKRVTDVMSEIAAASTEQLSGVEQVSRAVTQMDQVVQQNAGLVAETAAATEKMAAQTEHLVQAVARFRLDSTSDAQDEASFDTQLRHAAVPELQNQPGVSS